jgi:hypothetical protein
MASAQHLVRPVGLTPSAQHWMVYASVHRQVQAEDESFRDRIRSLMSAVKAANGIAYIAPFYAAQSRAGIPAHELLISILQLFPQRDRRKVNDRHTFGAASLR